MKFIALALLSNFHHGNYHNARTTYFKVDRIEGLTDKNVNIDYFGDVVNSLACEVTVYSTKFIVKEHCMSIIERLNK